MTWNIDEQPLEYQVKYWRLRAQQAEMQLEKERKRKTPPEREEFDSLQRELAQAWDTIRFERENTAVWKSVAARLGDDITQLKDGTRVPRLEQERDNYKRLWLNNVARLADAIEHIGLDYMPKASMEPMP
jgi:hypothetical protein